MAKDARLLVRMEQADLDWIKAEADKIGLDAATFVRSMIRKARNGLDQAPPPRYAEPDDYRGIDHSGANDHPGHIEIDIDALAAQESPAEAFPVARPGDMDAVRPVGARASRGELLSTFSGRK